RTGDGTPSKCDISDALARDGTSCPRLPSLPLHSFASCDRCLVGLARHARTERNTAGCSGLVRAPVKSTDSETGRRGIGKGLPSLLLPPRRPSARYLWVGSGC